MLSESAGRVFLPAGWGVLSHRDGHCARSEARSGRSPTSRAITGAHRNPTQKTAIRKFQHGVRFEAAHVRSAAGCFRLQSRARIALRARSDVLRQGSKALRTRWPARGTDSRTLRKAHPPLGAQSGSLGISVVKQGTVLLTAESRRTQRRKDLGSNWLSGLDLQKPGVLRGRHARIPLFSPRSQRLCGES